MNQQEMIRACPKAELHVHFDGSFSNETLFSYIQAMTDDAESEESKEPADPIHIQRLNELIPEYQDFKKFSATCTCKGKRSLQEMIKCFDFFCAIVRGNYKMIEDLAYAFVLQQVANNVIYTEVRYCPQLLHENGSFQKSDNVADPIPVIDAVTRGLRRGISENPGFTINQIMTCLCWRPDWSDELISIANERRHDFPCAIVGVDIGGGEEHFDEATYPELFKPHYQAMQRAQELQLNITLHAGEVSDSSMKLAIEEYGATRIGHGYAGLHQPDVLEMIKERSIHVEICPTSSFETGGWRGKDAEEKRWTVHPLKSYVNLQIPCSINSDDPSVFDTSLIEEYLISHENIGLSMQQIRNCTIHAIEAAFVDETTKKKLSNQITSWYIENGYN